MNARLSSEMLHSTTVAKDGREVSITGRSGSGKSDLGLRLLDRGFSLVSDDQTIVRRTDHRLIVSAPPTIKGKLEVRGIGIVEMDAVDDVQLCLVVELSEALERMPEAGLIRTLLGIAIPLVKLDAKDASAPVKVEIALDRLRSSA